MKLDSCQYSNIGGRKENQDAVGLAEDGCRGRYVVADGLGGHQAGHLSAQCAVQTLLKFWNPEEEETEESIAGQIDAVNDAILTIQQEEHCITKTTVVCLTVRENHAVWAHTGDSRLYYIHDGGIKKFTADHSVAYMKYRAGEITREQIPTDEDQSCLLRALGSPRRFEPDTDSVDTIQPGDAFLLCTDGMWEYLRDEEILQDCLKADSAEGWAAMLLRRAEERILPGNDNLSLITLMIR